jgi:DNA-binding CsgD family transcriptional regulator
MTAETGRRLTRTVFPAAAGERAWRRREAELAARVESVRVAVHAALGEPSPAGARRPALPAAPDGTEPWAMVTTLTEECVDRLHRCADPARARLLCELVLDLHELGIELGHHEVERRSRRLADCSIGLRRLRAMPSSADLFEHACQELVSRCGFGRAVLSRVEGGAWRPWTAHFSDDREFESWFAGWVDRPIPLAAPAPEALMLASRGPALVQDTETASVHRPIIIESGRSTSYVVAPIMRGKDVVGLLHADHFPSPRRVDGFDRDVLWSFAAGFGHTFERLALMERLRAHRDLVRGILATTARSMDDICEAAIDLLPDAPAAAPRQGRGAAPAVAAGRLTAREAEVFELVVAGATNGAIADRLVISEETVKTHVKHILRKLGVANRSQAIASCLGPDHPAAVR